MPNLNTPPITDALRQLLLAGSVSTQEEICVELETQGYAVNQSKVSRMLRKIGAVKTKNEQNQIVYRLPKEPVPPSAMSSLGNLVMNIVANEMVIILHTSPGSASLIARMLDYNQEKAGILGTVAGDDTILVLPKSIHSTEDTLKKIKSLLSNS